MNEIQFDENCVLQCFNEEELNDRLLVEQFTQFIRNLILHDFEKLIFLLYRIDVHEDKLRETLKQHPEEDAAGIIANMIIERQCRKIRLRKEMQNNTETGDEERW